jgi:hypothetical protein
VPSLSAPSDIAGATTGVFAIEIAMDELAYETGIDPVTLRLRNFSDIIIDSHTPVAMPQPTSSRPSRIERGVGSRLSQPKYGNR